MSAAPKVSLASIEKLFTKDVQKNLAHLLFNASPDIELSVMSQDHVDGIVNIILKTLVQSSSDKPNVQVFTPDFSKHSVALLMMPDVPFIIDTVWMVLRQHNLGIHHSFHPVVDVNTKGTSVVKLDRAEKVCKKPISIVWIEFDRCLDEQKLKTVAKDIEKVMLSLQRIVKDFPQMLVRLDAAAEMVKDKNAVSFLKWLKSENFIFLGYRHYDYKKSKSDISVKVTPKSGLGMLFDDKKSSVATLKNVSDTGTTLRYYLEEKSEVVISKTPDKSEIHRHANMDYIGIKEFNKSGVVVGEHRFLGLFTSQAYTTHVSNIPLIAQKIQNVEKRYIKTTTNTYNIRALVNILETFPRDELFLTDEDDLLRITSGILNLQERQHVRTFMRKSAKEGAVTAFIYLPMVRMNSSVRKSIEAILMDAYQGTSADFRVFMDGTNAHARIIYKIQTKNPYIDVKDDAVEQRIILAAKGWTDNLRHELINSCGEYDGLILYNKYEPSLTTSYQGITSPVVALDDVQNFAIMEELNEGFSVRVHHIENTLNIRLFRTKEPVPLSQIMPLFECLSLHVDTQNSLSINLPEQGVMWVHSFNVPLNVEQELDDSRIKLLKEAITASWEGKIENDRLNSLILAEGLTLTEVFTLRMFSAYAQQVNTKYAKTIVHDVLVRNANIAKNLAKLFEIRVSTSFASKERVDVQKSLEQEIVAQLYKVTSLDDDQTLRLLLSMIQAVVRSNYSSKGLHEPLAIKIDSHKVSALPNPKPWREIFVYHESFEGIHLRGGPVARGGLRHSDRANDFRTEVLGLMKAQMTKNTIIVPVGAKGGFYIKDAIYADSRQAYTACVEGYYKQFIQALLSLADNLIAGRVVHPTNVLIYDDEDPYFVVAADKGTATFSDIANNEAINARFWKEGQKRKDVGFWLGDAFASGGSQGYDHKKMGITARGAWESVKHHGQQLGLDVQTQDFTVVGIGDMGGDVFGNGMLLSKHIQLVAAFNHMHIFVDPEPEAATSYKERERLFKSGKGWGDYNQKLLSKGGMIYNRSDKSLKLTPQIKKRLGIEANTVTPFELMKSILKAKVDLLWNGGIGTYIKSERESHIDVADRANDEIRVNGAELRCRMVGEGGNLGATQAGRIEYALNGGLINTDALDNSAGVDSSDHEVNIKILLKQVMEKGLLTERQRNNLLSKMTESVAAHVLRNNYLQNQAITIKEKMGVKSIEVIYQLQDHLVKKGFLDASVEGLPDFETLETRRQVLTKGYTRPELAALMSYSKTEIYTDLLKSDLFKSTALESYLINYFPEELHQKYAFLMPKHRLSKEIISTVLTNDIVNRMGMTFINRMKDETGVPTEDVVAAYLISKTLYKADEMWDYIESLETSISADIQFMLFSDVKKLVEYGTFWVLRNFKTLNFGSILVKYSAAFDEIKRLLFKQLPHTRKEQFHHKFEFLCANNVPEHLAYGFAELGILDIVPDVAYTAVQHKQDILTVLSEYLDLGETLYISKLYRVLDKLPEDNNWQRIANLSLNDALHTYHRQLTVDVLKQPPAANSKRVEMWATLNNQKIGAYKRYMSELSGIEHPNHAMVQGVAGYLKGLVKGH